ncbi:hypothetical protein JVU11DRAFT_1276 [Chiua virens]|nr:hypothetical protein JVU11DRAFT_1276 [Chiua virens]
MVFTKLSVQEKEAFFGLLDEYFQSRPELFGQNSEGVSGEGLAGTGISTAAATSAVQRALATAGHVATSSTSGAGGTSAKSNNPYAANMQKLNVNETDVARAVSVGRVAAASLAFSAGQTASLPPTTTTDPPSLPRRGMFHLPASVPETRVGPPGTEVDKLVSRKASVFDAFKTPSGGGAVIPPAFVHPKGTFAPPPVRRVTSDTSTTSSASGGGAGGAGTRTAGRQVPAVPAAAEVVQGEWAEVLYDYSSEDPADLVIEADTRVFVTAKSSEDWWTGQVEGQGRKGLFPASYVKLL